MSDLLLRFSLERDTADLVADIVRVLFPDARTAVDLTPGHGRFWSELVPISVTVTFSPHDFRNLPYAAESFDVAMLDPPHVADAGAASIMGTSFGTYPQGELERVVRAGCREAYRVARLGALIKVCDHVHAQRFQRMSGWVYAELGEPYDVVHGVRSRSLRDGKWQEPQLSARNNGATYLIFRRGDQRHLRSSPIPVTAKEAI